MDALKAIFSRRSIRHYRSEKKVEEKKIDAVLAAACSAPSAHNGRAWEFIVIKNEKTVRELSKVKSYYEKPLGSAPVCIAVLYNPSASEKEVPEYMAQDCAAATQNMLVAATAMGLGSCWMGGILKKSETESVRRILELPEEIVFFGLVSIGYPAEKKPPRGQIETEKIHREKY